MAGMKFNADIDLKNIVKLRQEIDKLKKSLIEIASVPNSDAAVKALEKQLASALKKLEKYKDKYVQTQQARIDQEKAASEQIKKQQKEIDSLIKKYEALQKQIEKGTVRAPRSPKTYTDDQISVALKTQVQSIKEAREQLKVLRFAQANITDQQEREIGARTKLNIKIQENTRYLKLNSDAYTRQKMEIGNYEENIRRALDGTGQFNLSLSKMLGVIGGTAALKGLVTDMINVRGEFQKTSIAFETMLGSKEKADALMAQMVETAAKTPFDLQGVTSGAKQLLAYGTSADKVNETLVRLGNIASGLSIPLGDLVYLYGTSMSQGRLFTQDVNQFMGRGIPLVAELSKELGKTESEIRKMVTEGKVGFPELQKVIENMTNEGGKFYNLMEMQSTTLSGQISNLGDAWDSMLNSIGEDTQGIASMTISAVTSIIENYKEVGAIIASLVATYGTYKAAIVVVNMLERANIMILRQAVVEKKLAAAANIVLSNSMAIAAARGKIFATVQKNIISTFKGVGKALANPYVLFAAAVGTATYGLYKFYTRETEVEKMQKRYNETKEAAARREEQHKTKVEELIASIEDETKAEMERVGAMDLLKKMYPGIIEKYIDEEGHLKNLIALKKELSEADATRKAEENKTELRSYDERIKNQKEYIERMRTNDQSAFDDEIAKLEQLKREREKTRQKVVYDYINNSISGAKSMSDDELKNTIKAYKDALSQNMGGEWFDSNQDFKVDEIKQYVSALEDLQKARLNAVQNKEYWESKKKQAEDARDALDVSKKNSEEWNKYTKQIQEAQKQIDKYSDSKTTKEYNSILDQQKKIADLLDKQALERKRREEDLENQAFQARINTMKEGEAKIRAQRDLDNKKEIQDLERQREDYIRTEIEYQRKLFDAREELNVKKNKNYKKKTFDPSSVKVDTSSIDATIGYVSKRQINDQIRNQEEAWNEYIIKYGTFQQKKEAITRKYTDAINKAANAGEAASLQKEFEEALANLDLSKLKEEINWEMIFGDLSKVTKDQLTKIKKQLQEFKKSPEFKNATPEQIQVIETAINSINDALVDKGGFFGGLSNSLTEYEDAVNKVKEAQEELNKALEAGDEVAIEKAQKKKNAAENTQANAQANVEKSRDKAISNITAVADAMQQLGSAEFNLSSFGSAVGGLVDALSESGSKIGGIIAAILSLLDEFGKDGGVEFGKNIVNNVISAIGGTIEVPFKMLGIDLGLGGANYSDYNEMVAKYDVLLDVWDQLLDKKKAYINESYGAEATKAGKEALDLLKAERDITRELASERLDAGASAGSHSMAYRMWQGSYKYEGQNWKDVAGEISSALGGVEFSNMWNLLYMSADQLEWIKTNYSGLWSQMDTDFRGYLDDIIQYGETEAEIIESVKEQITGISFDSFRDSYVSLLSDLDSTNKDFADSFEEYLRKSILQSVIAKNYDAKIQELYDSWSKAGEDGLFSESEVDRLRSMQQSITDAMLAERDRLEEVFGWTSSSSQEASKKVSASVTQDSIDEVSGRFTALQIAGEEIKNQNQLQTMSILELRADMLPIIANTTGIKDIASETRDLLRLSYEELTGIHDDTTSMNKSLKNIETDIAEVKRNTNGLSKR